MYPSGPPSSLPSSSFSSLCNGQNGQFQLTLTTDEYGDEDTSWFLVETENPSIPVASSSASGYSSNELYIIDPTNEPQFCLKVGVKYTFTIKDEYGDGICCSYGNGSYIGYLDGEEIFTGGTLNFTFSETFEVSPDNGNG
mmetsp:Transcript_40843/g.45630  ORF Transcript_40843/g.45630 Transcript_40843/m.45630 type:complete len:140 (+) Transcript_40843:71-490(+)